jgi:hypothetical protein
MLFSFDFMLFYLFSQRPTSRVSRRARSARVGCTRWLGRVFANELQPHYFA